MYQSEAGILWEGAKLATNDDAVFLTDAGDAVARSTRVTVISKSYRSSESAARITRIP